MTTPLISLEVGNVRAQVEAIGRKLDAAVAEIVVATQEGMTEFSNDLVGEAQSRINNRSGDLSRSGTVEEVTISGDELVQRFGFNSKHARQTDGGGPIVPRNGKMLAIPLDPILTARGVPQYPSPRAEPGLFLLKLWGKLFLAKKMGSGDDSIQLHWLLTPRVEQKGTRFFSDVVQQRAPDAPRVIAQRVSAKIGGCRLSHVDVELRGFEAALFGWVGGAFRFAEVGLASIPLAAGRHFFVNIMPEVGTIVQTSAADAFAFDPAKEPTISAYTNAGPGIRPGPSRWVKHDVTLNFHLRVAGSFERAKALLEEFVQWTLDRAVGKRMGGFMVKAATLQQRPTAYQRQQDERSFAQATVRFLYVALNT